MKPCEICKKIHNKKRFCSIKCRSIGSRIYNKIHGIRPPSRKGIPWEKEWISKRQKTRKERGNNKLTKETIKKMQGARKIFYDRVGRKSSLTSILKRTKQYKDWRTAVFKRDKYTCQECGKKSGGGKAVLLQADHIKPKAILIRECGHSIDICLTYKPLWDIKNGRTLCRECHKKTPTYGLGALKWND